MKQGHRHGIKAHENTHAKETFNKDYDPKEMLSFHLSYYRNVMPSGYLCFLFLKFKIFFRILARCGLNIERTVFRMSSLQMGKQVLSIQERFPAESALRKGVDVGGISE